MPGSLKQRYKLMTCNQDWTTASHSCRAMHAHLVKIDNSHQQSELADYLSHIGGMYICLSVYLALLLSWWCSGSASDS